MGASLLPDKEFILNIYDVENIVDALEVNVSVERNLSVLENRAFDDSIQTTYSYLRNVENFMKRNDIKYASFSYSV